MYTIAIVNEKGGTGKTTTAVNLAAALGELQHKVLLVDLDGQAASSRWLGVEDDTRFADALYSGKGLCPLPNVIPNVSLAPASGKLDAVAHDLRPTQGGQLRKLLQELASEFEYCIIDCPPSLGNRLIGNALLAAGHAIVPVETSILALDGLKILLTTLDDVREGFGHNIGLAGVLACRFDARTRLSHMVLAELKRALPGKVFDTVIRENVRMRECPASGKSILEYAPDSHAAEDYRSLAKELVASSRLAQTQEADYLADRAAFQAADESMRFGDMLRQSVRKPAAETPAAAEPAKDEPASPDDSWHARLEEAQRRLAGEPPAENAFELPPADAEPADANQSPAVATDAAPAEPSSLPQTLAAPAEVAAAPAEPASVCAESAAPAAEPEAMPTPPAAPAESAATAPTWENWLTGDTSPAPQAQAPSPATTDAVDASPPAAPPPQPQTTADAPAPDAVTGDAPPAVAAPDAEAPDPPVAETPVGEPAGDQTVPPLAPDAAAPPVEQGPPTPDPEAGTPLWEEPAPAAANVDDNCPNLRRLLETIDWNKAAVEPKRDAKQPDKRGLLRRFLGK